MSQPILLVEDDPDSQELIDALCRARGHHVDVAGDGFLGLRLLSERRHSIVLIDYHLPEMDGFALARLMREIVGARGGLKLVGITADRHGLASRRGADALFDAILVKPLDPALLHAALERLGRPDEAGAVIESAGRPAAVGLAADTLWRRRGLPARPRAVLCPDLGPEMAAAVGEAFALGPVEAADLILVAAPEGLDGLRAMRASGPGRFLPAIDLDGRLGRSCDLGFRVDDAEAWSQLADLCRSFADRRASIPALIRESKDPAIRLLAFLHVGDRALSLSSCADPSAAMAEVGLSRAAVMSAILRLTEAGLTVCDASLDGVVVRLTEAGIGAVTGGPDAGAAKLDPRPDPGHEASLRLCSIAPGRGTPPGHRLDATPDAEPASTAVGRAPGPDRSPRTGFEAVPDGSSDDPVFDRRRIDTLRALIGDAELARLRDNLTTRLARAFSEGASRTAVASEAHALIAAAGSLGFTRLSTACRELQTAVSDGLDEARALRLARRAVREALDLMAMADDGERLDRARPMSAMPHSG